MDGKRLLRIAIVVCAAAMTAPGTAAAATCIPDQTVAALDQYCDALPNPAGAGPPRPAGAPAPRPLRDVLSPKQAERLRDAGPAGMAVLLLPIVSPLARAPLTLKERRRAERATDSLVRPGSLDTRDQDDVATVAAGMASAAEGVLGGAFRWGLVISSLGIAALTWLRLRSRIRL